MGHCSIRLSGLFILMMNDLRPLDLKFGNAGKCKELRIDFKRPTQQFNVPTVNSKEIEQVDSIKMLGITISNTLQWNYHISEIIKKAE